MEVVLITRKNGVNIKFSGNISAVKFNAPFGRFELNTLWLHDLKVEATDANGKAIDWTDYNVDLRPGHCTIYDVTAFTCA